MSAFTCPRCTRTTQHPEDVKARYCPFCRAFDPCHDCGHDSEAHFHVSHNSISAGRCVVCKRYCGQVERNGKDVC